MTCHEIRQAIDPYLDDELPVLEVLRVQAHLLRCEPCRGAMESEARLHSLWEADAMQDQASPALRARILERLSTVPSPPPSSPVRSRGWVAEPYAVLAGVTLIGVLLAALAIARFNGTSNLPPFIEEIAARHRLYTEVTGPTLDITTPDVFQVTGWLEARAGFPVKAPRLAGPDRHLVGGRVSSVADAPAAYLLYEWGGRRLSLFVMPHPPRVLSGGVERVVEGVELYTGVLHRITVVWWEDADRLYAVASTASVRDLEEFSLLCVRSGRGAAAMDPTEARRG